MTTLPSILCDQIRSSTEVKSEWKIYPNPFNDILNLESEYPNEFVFTVINSLGQKIFTSFINTGMDRSLDLNILPDGVYFIHISSIQR